MYRRSLYIRALHIEKAACFSNPNVNEIKKVLTFIASFGYVQMLQ